MVPNSHEDPLQPQSDSAVEPAGASAAQRGDDASTGRQSQTPVEDESVAAYDQVLSEESPGEADDSGSSPESRLAEAEREVLRARAELENFRKRMQRDAEQQLKYANIPLVRELVDVVDNLQRASEAAGQELASGDALRDGVEMTIKQLLAVLGKFGCKTISALGTEFDPNYHEAIAQMPSDEYPAGQVAQEVAVGYVLHDRVVRPSQVIVSTGAK
ncbi:MAG: nucleotide exchange factor GrpE [Planctomycetales bacterium]|nr:nucleotide exchange factor GrpE [Planctomycetales bacterium]